MFTTSYLNQRFKNDLAMGQLITFYNAVMAKEKLKIFQKLCNALATTILKSFDSKFIVTEGRQANA